MNPMTNVKNIQKLSEQDIRLGNKTSWHDQYKDSAWLFIGGLPYDLTEGDVICVFSQYGEVVNINLVRDKATGKQKGFCFLCYEDQRSTILAVDNLNGIKILNRTIRVDHVENYKTPKESQKNPVDDETRLLREEGCAPVARAPSPAPPRAPPAPPEDLIIGGVRLPPRLPIGPIKSETVDSESSKKSKKKGKDKSKKKSKKVKKEKSKKKKRKHSTSSSDSESSSDSDSDSSEEDHKRKHKKKKRSK